jgi:plasmid stabilization system protein ParE
LAFDVEITDSALRDAEQYVQYLRDERLQPIAAERWWNGFVDRVLSLEEQPNRHPFVPELPLAKLGVRQRLYHSHRIVFTVDDVRSKVKVLRVYHGKRRRLRPKDV